MYSGLVSIDSVRVQYYSTEKSLNKALVKNRVDVALLPFEWCVRNSDSNYLTPILTPIQQQGGALLASNEELSLVGMRNTSVGYFDAQNLAPMLKILSQLDSLNLKLVPV